MQILYLLFTEIERQEKISQLPVFYIFSRIGTRVEGIIPALESSHAVAYAVKLAATMSQDQKIIVNLSGRGDKDINTIATMEGIEI